MEKEENSLKIHKEKSSQENQNYWIWQEVPTTQQTPLQRSLHISVVHKNDIYIFGGYDGTVRTNDFYRYKTDKKIWEKIKAKGKPPSPRDRHAAVVYQDVIFIFGGYDGVNRVNDFFGYIVEENT